MGYEMKSIYDLGLSDEFETQGLGCVMLNTTSPVSNIVTPGDVIDNEYYAHDRERYKHISGLQERHHLTVRYGFLPWVDEKHMKVVADSLGDMEGAELDITDVEIFPSSAPGEKYECVVALLNSQGYLNLCHQQFGVLPNLQTFAFRPHITIGYFVPGFWEDKGVFNIGLKSSVVVTGWHFSQGRVL